MNSTSSLHFQVLDYWAPSLKLLSDIRLMETLKQTSEELKNNTLPTDRIQKIRKDFNIPKNPDLQPHIVAKASQAAKGLCEWILAMEAYERVAKVRSQLKKKKS